MTDYERTWWSLFQKRVFSSKFYIYVFILLMRELIQYSKINTLFLSENKSTERPYDQLQ